MYFTESCMNLYRRSSLDSVALDCHQEAESSCVVLWWSGSEPLVPLTAVHSSLQAQQQVRQPGLAGSRQVGVQAAALLPQVQLTGFSQRVTDSVVLRDQLLTGGQGVTALWGTRRVWLPETRWYLVIPTWVRGEKSSQSYLFWHGLFKFVIEQTLVDFSFSCLNLWRWETRENFF